MTTISEVNLLIEQSAQILEVAAKRGAFQIDEFSYIGAVYQGLKSVRLTEPTVDTFSKDVEQD